MNIDIDTIINNRQELNQKLIYTLSTMELKDTIFEIHQAIKENQEKCPHFSAKYNWVVINGKCPYCGFNLEGEKNAKSY